MTEILRIKFLEQFMQTSRVYRSFSISLSSQGWQIAYFDFAQEYVEDLKAAQAEENVLSKTRFSHIIFRVAPELACVSIASGKEVWALYGMWRL
eukprot:3141854-Pleurochrysis_carterae.AAC.1